MRLAPNGPKMTNIENVPLSSLIWEGTFTTVRAFLIRAARSSHGSQNENCVTLQGDIKCYLKPTLPRMLHRTGIGGLGGSSRSFLCPPPQKRNVKCFAQ